MNKNVFKTASIMIIFSMLSKVLGFLRDYMTAIKFGTTMEADAYLMASNIPNILFVIIGVAITTTFIPIYNEIKQNKTKKELIEFYSNVLSILVIISFALTILAEIFTPILVKIIAPGFYGDKLQLTILLTRILSSVIILNTVIYMFNSILQCEGNFFAPASIGIPYNIILIIYYIFFSDKYGVIGISIFVSIALVLQIIILYNYLKKVNFKYKFIINWKDKNLKRMLILLLPVCIGTGMTQLNGIFNGIFSSSLDSGSVAAMNYALKLNTLISDIIIMSIITVAYQNMTQIAAVNNNKELENESNKNIIIMFIVLIPIILVSFILGEYIVRILFERGAFDSNSTYLTASAFRYYSIGLFGIAINNLLTRVCYSIKDTKTPMIASIISIIINIILGFIFVKELGIKGIAIASTIGVIVSAIILYNRLRKGKMSCLNKKTIITLSKLFLSAIPMAILLIVSKKYILNLYFTNGLSELIKIFFVCLVGIVIYILFVCMLRVNEIKSALNIIIKKIKK